MANNRSAFERLLTSIPKFDSGKSFSSQKIMNYYERMETVYQSEIFMSTLILKRLARAAEDQQTYDRIFLKTKEISRLTDQLYELKYN